MKLILIRHGETLWNKERRVQGISDIELNDFGIEQAKKLGLSLKHEKIEAIYSSPLKRAYRTAQEIGHYHNVPIEIESDLREMTQGDFEGLTYKELREKYESFLKEWMTDPASVVMPNGESLFMLQNRAWPVISRIMGNAKNAVVVSHNFTLSTILCKIQNISLSEFRLVRIDTASKSIIEIENGIPHLRLLNDTNHLQEA